MSTPTEQIRQLLSEHQSRYRLSDRDMAARLGLHFTYWSKLRRRPDVPPRLLSGFVRLFPRRMGLVREFLTGEPEEVQTA